MKDYSQLNGSGLALKAADQLTVSREELKYLVGLEDRLFLIRAFDQILKPDAYGGYAGYAVRSVYFDGRDNQDYVEKRIKPPFNKRVRLRVYSPTDQTAKFEIKKKWTAKQIKDTVVVSRAHAQEMLAGNFDVLKHYDSPTAELGYEICTTSSYRPVSMVEYKRRAYTHPQFSTRITLDNDLRYSDKDLDLFSQAPIDFRRVTSIAETILEVKYERYLLPQIQSVLSQVQLKKCPYSKFGSSRSLLEDYYY